VSGLFDPWFTACLDIGLSSRYDAGRPKAHVEDEKEEDIPKVCRGIWLGTY
jgi:hypothetical protein